MAATVKGSAQLVNRRIGGLEKKEEKHRAHDPVNRRIGGLEIPIYIRLHFSSVNRRIGGLENRH